MGGEFTASLVGGTDGAVSVYNAAGMGLSGGVPAAETTVQSVGATQTGALER